MSSSRKKLILNTVSMNLGCGSCTRPNLSHIFHPKPNPKNPTYSKNKLYNHSSSSNSTTPTNTATTFSPCCIDSSNFSESETYVMAHRKVGGFGRSGREGVAVEKDSDDPYLDFRQSMMQMILENEIYSKDDLRELLNCFLHLNSPYHHGAIVRAFTDIRNGG
ncbi:hypothetical protein TanjilG_19793 [Lupinus angustifolius]|uniref:Transcription repressor n=1 Tax=Lupinus angustifolius TaxID=3871 RepID=A0A1J7HFE6_LUPAN|nr:PREDICTED: transcription repressor OFP6-like [Lupinus angustifolius]OIW05162.1 hypothetical protein TanjilG_19793 [Lupinus angustifolius]